MILYDPNGNEIHFIRYRQTIGFITTFIPIEDEKELGDHPLADCVSSYEVWDEDDSMYFE